MPIEWIPLAVDAALLVARPVLADAYKGSKAKLQSVLSEGPLSKPLRKAYQEAFTGFHNTLAEIYDLERDKDGMNALAQHEAFQAAVSQLPYVPFRQI